MANGARLKAKRDWVDEGYGFYSIEIGCIKANVYYRGGEGYVVDALGRRMNEKFSSLEEAKQNALLFVKRLLQYSLKDISVEG